MQMYEQYARKECVKSCMLAYIENMVSYQPAFFVLWDEQSIMFVVGEGNIKENSLCVVT